MSLPIFAGRRTCAEHLGCWMGRVEKLIGPADVLIRVGIRDDPAWLQERLDHLLKFAESPSGILYVRKEAHKRAGITIRVAQRLLSNPVAFLASGYGNKMLPLFCERQIYEIRAGISRGTIKIQTRSLKAPKLGAYFAPARHSLASDIATEAKRIQQARLEPAFWSRNV